MTSSSSSSSSASSSEYLDVNRLLMPSDTEEGFVAVDEHTRRRSVAAESTRGVAGALGKRASMDDPNFEVMIPIEEDFVGQLDADELFENVNMERAEPDVVVDVEEAEDREKMKSSMVFYIQNQPTFHAETLADLRGSSIIRNIENLTFWLDVWGYDLQTLSVLSKIFGIHPLTVEDILEEDHREKCELFEDYTFICIRALLERNEDTGSRVDYGVVYLICTEKFVISFHLDKLPRLANIYTRLEKLSNLSLTPGWILYTILDNCVDGFFPIVSMMEIECESIDELALLFSLHSQNEILIRISQARRNVTILLKLITHKVEIFKMLQSRSQKFERVLFQKDVLLYLGDVQDHVVGMEQTLLQQTEALSRAHGAYLAQVSVELTHASNRMGASMKKFTAGACIFLPLTLIASVMGVNIEVPFQLGGPNSGPQWFYVLLAFMLCIAIILTLIGRRLKWFTT